LESEACGRPIVVVVLCCGLFGDLLTGEDKYSVDKSAVG
jgi:hypothetical protein